MAVEASQEALDEIATLVTELRTVPPTTVLVDLLQVLSRDVCDKDLAAATALDREAIAAARAIGDPDTIAHALLRSAWAWWVNGDLDAQRSALLQALQHIEATGAERHLTEVLGWLGANAGMHGVFVEASQYAARTGERVAASGSSLQRATALRAAVWTALWRGDLHAAVERAQQAVDAAIDAGARDIIGVNYWFLGEALDAAGEFVQARTAHDTAIDRLSGLPSQGLRAEARTRLVKTLVSLGELHEARRQAELAGGEVAASDVYTLATSAAALAAVCAARGNADGGRAVVPRSAGADRPDRLRVSAHRDPPGLRGVPAGVRARRRGPADPRGGAGLLRFTGHAVRAPAHREAA